MSEDLRGALHELIGGGVTTSDILQTLSAMASRGEIDYTPGQFSSGVGAGAAMTHEDELQQEQIHETMGDRTRRQASHLRR